MGIADLWPILGAASDARIPFPVFLSRFLAENGRPPRLAIDAYMFMFWLQLPDTELDPLLHRRVIRNFMAKLWYLVQNNVLFVVVFDGKYKPGKLRNGHIPEIAGSMSYDELLRLFRDIPTSKYPEGSSLVESLKNIFQKNRIDWVQAPAEAEAECAWLQRLGVVDYVVSDDSDTLVFGATRVLRMFNRVKYFDEEANPVLSSTDYYVTPVHMSHVTERTGLTRERLILIAVLRGGDYSTGAENIGITRAKEIALCGTTMLLDLPRKALQDFGSLPDFTRMFVETFVDLEKATDTLPDPYYGLKSELDRSDSLAAFNVFLDTFLKTSGRNIFGRTTSLQGKVVVDDYYSLLYFFPLVNRKIFKFMPHLASFAELLAIDTDLSVDTPSTCQRYNLNISKQSLGELVVDQTQRFIPTSSCPPLTQPKFVLPRERKYNLKAFTSKLVREEKFREHITLARTREFEGVRMAVLKFQRIKLNEAVYLKSPKEFEVIESEEVNEVTAEDAQDPNSLIVEQEEDEDKMLEVAMPLAVLEYTAPDYVREYERTLPKRSPRKKAPPPQKTTLDSIWPGMLPKKGETPSLSRQPSDMKLESKLNGSPRSSPRRRRKEQLLPGQTNVMLFFQTSPFQAKEVVLVPSDDENDFMKMQNIVSDAPLLRPKAKVESRLSSPELSPSKRVRSRMQLSPDSSPVKVKRDNSDMHPPVQAP